MAELELDDRTFTDDDGTWTRLRFIYGSPYSNGGPPDVSVHIETFQKTEGKGFDFARPTASKFLILDEVNVGLLAGYLNGVNDLMWRQWTQYIADERARDGNKPDV
jgi:hypothetical protein